jgi:hypothetical protein
MNKLAPLFTATALVLSGAAFAGDAATATASDPSAQPDASQAQETQPKGFVLIQRNIYVPVDAEGKVASQNWVVIDKQGFVTVEELEAAKRAQGDGGESRPDTGNNEGDAEHPAPLQGRHAPGKGPVIAS